jgi:hypothetical protein
MMKLPRSKTPAGKRAARRDNQLGLWRRPVNHKRVARYVALAEEKR